MISHWICHGGLTRLFPQAAFSRNNGPAVKHHASRDQYLDSELTALTLLGSDLRITGMGPSCGPSKAGDSTNIAIRRKEQHSWEK